MPRVSVSDPFENLTQSEIRNYVNKRTGFDPTTIKNKDPNRHYRLIYRNSENIRKFREQGYVVMDSKCSKGEELLGASKEKPFECGDCILAFTDKRIQDAAVRAMREENRRLLGAPKREMVKEIRQAEKEAGLDPGKVELFMEDETKVHESGEMRKLEPDEIPD